MMERVEATKDELEAFKIAMDMEKKGNSPHILKRRMPMNA